MSRSTYLGFLLIISILSLSLAVYLLVDLTRGRQATVASARETARQQAITAASEIDAELRELQAIVRGLTEELSAGSLSQGEIGSRLTRMMEDDAEIRALGVADESFQTFYRVRRGEPVETGRMEDDDADIGRYASAIENGAGWSEPVWDQTEQGMMATYSAPFFRIESDRDATGVAYLTISMDRIEERIGRLRLGKTGYGAILSKQGYFLVHPSEAMVRRHVSAFQITEQLNDGVLREAVERATGGESGFADHINLLTGQSSWFLYEPVGESGWSAVVIRITDEILTIGRFFRHRVIWISIYSILGLLGVAAWVSSHWYRARPGAVLWGLVALLSLLLLAASGVIRYVVYHQVLDEDRERVTVLDAAELNAFLRSQRDVSGAPGQEPPFYLPTGVSVQTLKFTSPQELLVTAYVWQKFPVAWPPDLPKGFTFPNAVSASISEAYRRSENGIETVGWYVEAVLRQDLDTSKYPYDHDTVSIRLWSKNFERGVLLVPDLASYTLTNPTSRPGLHEEIVLPGWRISGSFFDYQSQDYGTDFGLPGQLREGAFPELSFNVALKRNLLNVVIGNVIPVAIVMIMLFSVIVTSTKDEDEAKILGFGPSGAMRISSALFFVILLAHIHLRDTLQLQETAFVEYIYFVTYFAIILTTLHAFFFSLKRFDFWVVEYRESLIIKLAFWPLWLLFLFAVTLAFFY